MTVQLLKDILGVTAVIAFLKRYGHRGARINQPWYALPGFVLVQATIFTVLFHSTGAWWSYLALWVLPLLVIPPTINRFRTIVEHTDTSNGRGVNRSTVPKWWEYLLIAPYGYSYHFVHHLLMTIPYYRLKGAHEFLVASGAPFTFSEVAGQGYWRALLSIYRALPNR